MSGNVGTIIAKVNKDCDDLDFVHARSMMEANLLKLSEAKYYRLLNTNAQVPIKHIVAENKEHNGTTKQLTRSELLIINKINEYCTNFDVSMLKRTLKNAFDLVQRPEVLPLLNSDAKIILNDMGALLGMQYQVH